MTTSRATARSEAVPAADTLESPILAISTISQLAMFLICWAGIGLAMAVLLRRRSHEFGPNAALGLVLGPLFIFLAFDMIRRRETEEPITLSSPPDLPGSAVLVVAVGDLEGVDEAVEALENLDDVGPIIAAVPVEYEVALRVHTFGADPPTSDPLDQLADKLCDFQPGLMMLPGRIERALPRAVRATGADVLMLVGSDSDTAAPGVEEQLRPRVVRIGL